MTLKKLVLASVATVALTSTAFAAGQWGVGLGIHDYSTGTATTTDVTYLNSQFIVKGGFGYANTSTAGATTHGYNTLLSFGMRNMMNNKVSFDYGIAGAYGFENASGFSNPYNVGAFVGVDYSPVQNILLTARVQPYNYGDIQYSAGVTTKTTSLFSVGSLSVSYMFS